MGQSAKKRNDLMLIFYHRMSKITWQ